MSEIWPASAPARQDAECKDPLNKKLMELIINVLKETKYLWNGDSVDRVGGYSIEDRVVDQWQYLWWRMVVVARRMIRNK